MKGCRIPECSHSRNRESSQWRKPRRRWRWRPGQHGTRRGLPATSCLHQETTALPSGGAMATSPGVCGHPGLPVSVFPVPHDLRSDTEPELTSSVSKRARRRKTLLCKSPTSDPATKRPSPQALDHTGSGTKVTPSLCSLVGPVTAVALGPPSMGKGSPSKGGPAADVRACSVHW